MVTAGALARAFHKAHQTGEYAEFVDGQLKGAASSGATLAAASLVGALGGPAGLAMLVGMTTGVLAHKTSQNITVSEIGDFLAERATVAATEVQEMSDRYAASFDIRSRIDRA